jgi:hypothetical protein
MNITINRFKVELNETKEIGENPIKISFLTESEAGDKKYLCARYKPSNLLSFEFVKKNETVINWLNSLKKKEIKDEEIIYISFKETNQYNIEIRYGDLPTTLKKKFLKEKIISSLLTKEYIIDPFPTGVDLCIYKDAQEEKANFKKYNRYDINIITHQHDIELVISFGSNDTYIGKLNNIQKDELSQQKELKFLTKDNLLIKLNEPDFDLPVKANFEIRKSLGINPNPIRRFYKKNYDEIELFVKDLSKQLKDSFTIYTNFKRITEENFNIVDFDRNKMIFKDNNTDYSTINGMRDYGPYKLPQKISETKLLFIYPDKESANKLYSYLSRGYRHFPGIESYVGIPANISEKKIFYENNYENIINKIRATLTEDKYENLIAICIMPFSKTNATPEQSNIYYKIKEILLRKNIPSQFIERDKIFMDNFHFSLPNIAIAMFSKLGGVPWRLKKDHYNQLTIGFNVYRKGQNSYLGSAVYFDNQGIIKQVRGFKGESVGNICDVLISSINEYKQKNNEASVNKIVIHYYKTLSNEENKKINETIKNSLGPEFSFAIVEINDTKTTVDLCFDLNYESLMPQSGTYIRLRRNEYLLFNNLRYWEKPINPINQEEYPVKLKIYDPLNSFDHNELISQVYEFSRLYWKSLKQKAQPVTTIYSKLIAEYIAHFENNSLTDNEISKSTVWFI